MKKLFLLPAAVLCLAFAACEQGGNGPEGYDPDTVLIKSNYPPLIEIMPEEYEVKQKKSDKRGVCTNFSSDPMVGLMGPGISWVYNWAHSRLSDHHKKQLDDAEVQFIPMVWSGNANTDNLIYHKNNVPGLEYVLGYNEPNLTDQANMTPAQTAAIWPQLKAAAQAAGLKIISPAVNYGTLPGYSDPVVWLDEFFKQPGVSIDDIDGIAVHCYMSSAGAVKSFIGKFDKYNKPIWLTEFCAWDKGTNADSQTAFLSDICQYLEADPRVAKYAWFKDINGASTPSGLAHPSYDLIEKGNPMGLTVAGEVYVNMSSLDKETYYAPGEIIPAEHYSGSNITGSANPADAVRLRPTTDAYGILDVSNFAAGRWIEYNIDVPQDAVYRFDIRYSTQRATQVVISSDGKDIRSVTLPVTTSNLPWMTYPVALRLKAGKQVVRIAHAKGNCSFNWFRVVAPVK